MPKFNKHIVIVGTARSGTSWLSETLAAQHRYRLLFEPEHETQTKKGHLLCDKWITSDNASAEVKRYLRLIFYNRVDSNWIAQNSNRTFKRHLWPFIPKKFIVKFVRGNLLAEFLSQHYSIPVVHLIRNPYDVIASQQKVKFPWLYDLSHFQNQKKLVDVLSENYNIDVSSWNTLSEVETLTMRWCIENVIPIESSNSYTTYVNVMRYEDLFSDIAHFYRLCEAYDLEPVANLEQRYKSPSSKTNFKSNSLENQTNQQLFSKDDLNKINDILDKFKTSLYPRQ